MNNNVQNTSSSNFTNFCNTNGSINSTIPAQIFSNDRLKIFDILSQWVNETNVEQQKGRKAAQIRIMEVYDNKSKSLNLSYLSLNTLPPKEVLASLTSLTSLNLKNNYITTLEANIFNDLTGLNSLDLSANRITIIEANVFNNLTSLISLNLKNNYITIIGANMFNGLNSLNSLDLCDNRIITMETNAFNNLISLTSLHLAMNHISTIKSNMFNGLTSLTELNLGHNRISTIESNTFSSLIGLISLSLRDNRITIIETNTFNNLTNLIELNLCDNRITKIEANAFSSLADLAELNLCDNNITTVEINAFNGLSGQCDILPSSLKSLINISFKDKLNKIIFQANLNYELIRDWNKFEFIGDFEQFIERTAEIADMKSKNILDKKNALRELANIIIKIDLNDNMRKDCFNIATTSLGNCGDAINIGFLRMQLIVNKLNYSDNSLATIYNNQKILLAFEFIINNIVNVKIAKLHENGIQNPDHIEIGLAYLKGLNDYLDITVNNMLYQSISHVTDQDIVDAQKELQDYLNNENNIYSAMVDSDVIKEKYKIAFHIIEYQDQFDTVKFLDSNYNSNEALQIMNDINHNLIKTKINFIKTNLKIEKFDKEYTEKVNIALGLTDRYSMISNLVLLKNEFNNTLQNKLANMFNISVKHQNGTNNLEEDLYKYNACIENKYDWNKNFRVSFESYQNGIPLTEYQFKKQNNNIRKTFDDIGNIKSSIEKLKLDSQIIEENIANLNNLIKILDNH